ncbi:MAG TPA: FtsQ-type POTRA domain-containing protein [Polyangiaceae bacterium]|nr:FtsQ-type POTRA domain-containing protein [Polyangiaceae bacterium]
MTPANRRVGPARLPADIAGDDGVVPPATEVALSTGPDGKGRAWSSAPGAFRTVAGVVLVTAASVAVGLAARRCVLKSARFAITSIEVVGSERRPSTAIVAESGLVSGTNIFAADLDAARARILQDPWIVDATLVRRLPGMVAIRITERRPAALVALDETYLATDDGVPFKKLEPEDPIDLPLVTGVTPERVGADRDGASRTIGRAIDLAAEYERSSLGKRSPLQEVHVGADGRFALVVGHSGLQLVLGGPPFRRKLDLASRVLAEVERRGGKADVVMLDSESRPDRVVVRMR